MGYANVTNLWLSKFENDNSGRHNKRQQTKGERFPGFQGNQCECERKQNGGLEFQTEHERNQNLLNEAASYKVKKERERKKNRKQTYKTDVINYKGFASMIL